MCELLHVLSIPWQMRLACGHRRPWRRSAFPPRAPPAGRSAPTTRSESRASLTSCNTRWSIYLYNFFVLLKFDRISHIYQFVIVFISGRGCCTMRRGAGLFELDSISRLRKLPILTVMFCDCEVTKPERPKLSSQMFLSQCDKNEYM